MIRAIIIDDEPQLRKSLAKLLSVHCPSVSIAGEAECVESAFEAIKRLQPDLIFLDIRMEDGTGFDLLKKFDKINFHIIFVTAFEEYAIKAFHFSAIDYLLKPVDPEELKSAIEKLKGLVNTETGLRTATLLKTISEPGKQNKKIVLRTADRFHFTEISEILYCASDGNYTSFYLNGGVNILVSKTIKEYEDLLLEYGFFRAHRSFLINIAHISSYDKADGGYIIMTDNSRIPISSRKKDEFMRIVEGM
jgi:two-component system LytT family response regulator